MLAHPDMGFVDGGIDFAQLQLYDACCAPFGTASPLPVQAFTSAVFQDLENEKIWTRDWVCIGTLPEIANPGDLLPYTIGQHAIHIQRAGSGGLIGRFNKAQHGGCRAIPAQCRTGRKTKCSYTSCGFSRDRDVIAGSLLDEMTPQAGQYLGVYPERLLPVKSYISGPFVFANIDPTLGADVPPPVVEWDTIRAHARVSGHWREYRSNWKFVLAALVDASAAHVLGGENSHVSAEFYFPNLVIVSADGAALAVIVQPIGFDQALWRISAFRERNCPDATYDRSYGELIAAIERAGEQATARQDGIDRGTVGETVERSRTAWEFNQVLVQRINAEHVAYWNAPLTRASAGR